MPAAEWDIPVAPRSRRTGEQTERNPCRVHRLGLEVWLGAEVGMGLYGFGVVEIHLAA
jgi:hypothetical protein